MKMTAYQLETDRVRIRADVYRRTEQDGRKLVVSALKSKADLKIVGEALRVTLAPQSATQRDNTLAALCQKLNAMDARYPGSNPHPIKGRLAAEHTCPLGCLCKEIVLLWYLHNGRPQQDVEYAIQAAPWYRHKTRPSFANRVAALRRKIWMLRPSSDPALHRLRRKVIAFISHGLWAA